MDGNDPKSDPSVATHTTDVIPDTDIINGISTQKLYPLFINQAIQAVVRRITPLVTSELKVVQESLSPCQMSLPQANVKDRASIFRTTWNVIGTKRDRATPRDASSSETRSRASYGIPPFVATSVSPTRIGNKDIFSPSNSSTARRGRNFEPFDVSVNGFPAVNEHYTSYFSGLIDVETVSTEAADVNLCKRVNFASNSVFGETPKFVDLGLSPSNTADKLKTIFVHATRAGGLTDNSDGLTSSHAIANVTADRVSEAKAYSDYIKNSEFETMNVFEFENNSGTRLNQNIQMTRPDQDISRINPESQFNSDSRINPDSRISSQIRIKSPIRPTFNILLTRPTEDILLTRPTEDIPLTRQTENIPLTRPTYFELLT